MWTEGAGAREGAAAKSGDCISGRTESPCTPGGRAATSQADGATETAQRLMAASVTGTRREAPGDPAGDTAWIGCPWLPVAAAWRPTGVTA